MEKLRMYNPVKKQEEKEPLKTPLLTIRGKDFCAVDEHGKRITTLIRLETRERPDTAQHALIEEGFRTDWAKWGIYGAFESLIEDVEG